MIAALALTAIVLSAASGLSGLVFRRRAGAGERLAAAMMVAAAAAGIAAGVLVLIRGPVEPAWPWPVPGGELAFRIDALAAMFLVQIFLLAALGSVYGLAYWPRRERPDSAGKVSVFYGLATAGMALLVIAKNAVLFMAGWEIMALPAFLLVSAEDDKAAARESGLVYLISTRFATLCLFAFFSLLHAQNGSFDLSAPAIPADRPIVTGMFFLALAGFGLKAGVMPLHLWLPGAHANAPTHVSALMSGVFIKMGIYGLARFFTLFPSPPLWWGQLVLAAGAVSAVLGVVLAIGQHDIKRLLAYHSVENIGIILMGLGAGLLGRSAGDAALFALGTGGALLHVWNHGLFKALLFLSAGSVVHATGTRDIDALGGLSRRMPLTSAAFVTGAVAICGLPPLNGFVSELFVYLGLLRAAAADGPAPWMAGAFAAAALALAGALALACFVKVFGAAFLGEPRTEAAARAAESGPLMLAPMAVLSACCAVIGLAPGWITPVLDRALLAWPAMAPAPRLSETAPLGVLSAVGGALVAATVIGVLWARRGRAQPVVTWDCGYAAPSARMQYTSSSFADMLVGMFAGVLGRDRRPPRLTGLFPRTTAFSSHVPELVLDRAVMPIVRLAGRALSWFRWVQHGAIQLYVLYVLAALLLLLFVWR